jgi:hypothetical protein
MALRRTLHKKISVCEQLADVSDLAKLAYTWGILHADDWGALKASPRGFKAEVLPLHSASVDKVARAIDELVTVKLVVRYSVDGLSYLWFPTFDAYQEGLHKRTNAHRLGLPHDADPGTIENAELVSRNFPEIPASRARGSETKGNEKNQDNDSAPPADAADADPLPANPPAETQPEVELETAKPPRKPSRNGLAYEACLRCYGLDVHSLDATAKASFAKAMNALVADTSLEQVEAWAAQTGVGTLALGTGAKPERKVPAEVRKAITAAGWQEAFAKAKGNGSAQALTLPDDDPDPFHAMQRREGVRA